MKTRTKGNIIIEEIKVGDIQYEYDFGIGVKSEVLTLPEKDSDGNWVWKNKNLVSGILINYLVNPNYPQYSLNLYDNEAYSGVTYY